MDRTQQRRDFLRQLAAAGAATLLAEEPRLLLGAEGEKVENPRATADSCILLWMAGGMAAPDTFDPKRYVPFEVGLPVAKIESTFPAIDTVVDNVKITAGLENVAQVMDRATLIRSHVLPDLGSILHSRHQYHWHTGYVPPQTVACPHIGAWMARVLGPLNPVMPAFINVGQRLEGVGEQEELKAFTTAGFFGSEFGPMNLPFPEEAVQSVRPPKGMEGARFANRHQLFRKLVDQSPERQYLGDFQRESQLRAMENAYRLLSAKEREAFDVLIDSVRERITSLIDELRAGPRDAPVVLVSHGDPLRILVAELIGLPPGSFRGFAIDNGSISLARLGRKRSFVQLLNWLPGELTTRTS